MTTLPTALTPASLRDPAISRLLFADPRLSPLWLILRLSGGYEWLSASWGKTTNPAGVRMGEKAGAANSGFLTGALARRGVAAFVGGVMNARDLLAGTVSTNPLLFILATWPVLVWRVAGWWAVERWVLGYFGVSQRPAAATPAELASRRRHSDAVR